MKIDIDMHAKIQTIGKKTIVKNQNVRYLENAQNTSSRVNLELPHSQILVEIIVQNVRERPNDY